MHSLDGHGIFKMTRYITNMASITGSHAKQISIRAIWYYLSFTDAFIIVIMLHLLRKIHLVFLILLTHLKLYEKMLVLFVV